MVKKGKKEAIWHRDGKISEWWDDIRYAGLIYGKSGYYVVRNQDGKHAIFDLNGK